MSGDADAATAVGAVTLSQTTGARGRLWSGVLLHQHARLRHAGRPDPRHHVDGPGRRLGGPLGIRRLERRRGRDRRGREHSRGRDHRGLVLEHRGHDIGRRDGHRRDERCRDRRLSDTRLGRPDADRGVPAGCQRPRARVRVGSARRAGTPCGPRRAGAPRRGWRCVAGTPEAGVGSSNLPRHAGVFVQFSGAADAAVATGLHRICRTVVSAWPAANLRKRRGASIVAAAR